jgi:aquaporin NIP
LQTAPLARALAAEAIGTFALVFAGAGAGAVMVDAKTQALGQVGIALTFGLVIMAMIYAVGHISGAHFNGALAYQFVRGEATRPAELREGASEEGPA